MANKHDADKVIIKECAVGTEWFSTQPSNNIQSFARSIGVEVKSQLNYVIEKESGTSSRIWKYTITDRPQLEETESAVEIKEAL